MSKMEAKRVRRVHTREFKAETVALSRKWIGAKMNEVGSLSVSRAALYRRDLDA
jgi:hypothetical protein